MRAKTAFLVFVVFVAACGDPDTAETTTSLLTGTTEWDSGTTTTLTTEPEVDQSPATTTTFPERVDVEPLAAYQIVEIHDPMINGFRALSLMVPEGWTVEGGIHWDHMRLPLASATLRITDPTGAYGLETHWPHHFSWTTNPAQQFPGGLWMGAAMAEPRSAVDALRDLVLPHIRPSATIQGVVPVQPPTGPEVPGHQLDAARVRITYDSPIGVIAEDFHIMTSYLTADMGFGMSITNWDFSMIYSMWAPIDEIDQVLPDLELIMASAEVDMRWMSSYLKVREMFSQNNHASVQAAGQLSNLITQTYDEISQIHRQTWESSMASQDRIHQNFTDYIRDTQRVQREDGGSQRVPRGVACQRTTDGTILVLPDGALCPVDTVRLPQVP